MHILQGNGMAIDKEYANAHKQLQYVPRSVGRLPSTFSIYFSPMSTINEHSFDKSKQSETLTHLLKYSLSTYEGSKIDNEFSYPMHCTATPFSYFENDKLYAFFKLLKPCWTPPSRHHLCEELLDHVYNRNMTQALDTINNCKCVTMVIDGGTNFLSKSISNVILHTPIPFFVSYLRSFLKGETIQNVVAKVKGTVARLKYVIGYTPGSFVSDSCNGMRAVRRTLLEDKVFKWVYGCVAHWFSTFCEDICKMSFTELIKMSIRRQICRV